MRPALKSTFGILFLGTLMAAASLLLNPGASKLLVDAPGPGEITLSRARQQKGPVLWLDARPSEAFARDHIPEALPLNLDHWEEQIVEVMGRWTPGATVIVYCDDLACGSSHKVAEKLRREYHIDPVLVLRHGWAGWLEARNR
jgi:rhodanese-related sulfurtransferase